MVDDKVAKGAGGGGGGREADSEQKTEPRTMTCGEKGQGQERREKKGIVGFAAGQKHVAIVGKNNRPKAYWK